MNAPAPLRLQDEQDSPLLLLAKDHHDRYPGRDNKAMASAPSWLWHCSPLAAKHRPQLRKDNPRRRRSLPTVSDLSSSHPGFSSSYSDDDSQIGSHPSKADNEDDDDERDDEDEDEDDEGYGTLSVDTTFWSLGSLSGPVLTTTSTSTAPTATSSLPPKAHPLTQSRCWAPTFSSSSASSSASSVDSMELFPPHDDQTTVAWSNVGDDHPGDEPLQPDSHQSQPDPEQVEVDWEVWHIHAYYDPHKVPLFRVESTRTEAGGVTATLRAEEIGAFIRSVRNVDANSNAPSSSSESCTASSSSSVLRDVELVMTQDPETCHNELVRFIQALVHDQDGQLLLQQQEENAPENSHLWARLKRKLIKKHKSDRRKKSRPHPFSSTVVGAALGNADSDTQAALGEVETNAPPAPDDKTDSSKCRSPRSPRGRLSRGYLLRRSPKLPSPDVASTFLEELKQQSARHLLDSSKPETVMPPTPTRTASSSSDGSLRTVRRGNQRGSSERVEIAWTPPPSPPQEVEDPDASQSITANKDTAIGWSVQAFYNDVGNLIFHMSNGSVVLKLS